jgi:hypothetical protein
MDKMIHINWRKIIPHNLFNLYSAKAVYQLLTGGRVAGVSVLILSWNKWSKVADHAVRGVRLSRPHNLARVAWMEE